MAGSCSTSGSMRPRVSPTARSCHRHLQQGVRCCPATRSSCWSAKPGPTVLVPDLHGVAEADAVNQLLDANLKPGRVPRPSTRRLSAGALLSTNPAAGVDSTAAARSPCRIARREPSATPGPTPVPTAATVAIPDIRGMDEATGFNTLLDTDLLPGVRTEAFDPDIAAGDVISTDPPRVASRSSAVPRSPMWCRSVWRRPHPLKPRSNRRPSLPHRPARPPSRCRT